MAPDIVYPGLRRTRKLSDDATESYRYMVDNAVYNADPLRASPVRQRSISATLLVAMITRKCCLLFLPANGHVGRGEQDYAG